MQVKLKNLVFHNHWNVELVCKSEKLLTYVLKTNQAELAGLAWFV